MNANELRRAFTDFFVSKDHAAVASASLIPHDDTLLFTNSGMVPFKPIFVGDENPPAPRATTVQKCVRAGGKHNDLDEVGRTARHLTFFEMMGNFSFGDYFKREAIAYAWEFVTEVLGLDTDKLWVTVHLTDDDAEAIWRDEIGVPAERIQRLDEDNWWRMADTGPNGPCSEIFYDLGPEMGADGGPEHGAEERFVEIWNLVFMQFEQLPDGSQVELPKPSIDTGAGLERVLTVLQGVESVWATDEFQKLLQAAGDLAGVHDGDGERSDVSLRILADHARSTTFLINDGVYPSNEDRGYVLRRIFRRAVRHAYILGVDSLIMPQMVDTVVELMGADYPELVKNHEVIRGVVEREEKRFRETLKTGSSILDDALDGVGEGGTLPGDVAFKLHDTYGFPLEVTEEILAERGVALDHDGFTAAMAEQKNRAKAARKGGGDGEDMAPYLAVMDQHGPTEFVGRDHYEAEATVLLVDDDYVVLDRTPFYAESGGQIGDTGTISADGVAITVGDTTSVAGGIHRHAIAARNGELEVGMNVTAAIDAERRDAIRRNHTGTHILHWAMREVLGDHVKQQGSWVGPDRLRFDFSHFEAVTADEIAQIEDLVNAELLGNGSCDHFETSMEEATALGAIAFFGDKYGDRVRVLKAGDNSIELCGGTHVGALGDIGMLKIVSEGSIGSNLRRFEAITGTATLEKLRGEEATLAQASELLGVASAELVEGVQKRLGENKELRNEVTRLKRLLAVGQADALAAGAVDGSVVAMADGVDRETLRDLAVAIRDKGVDVVVLGASPDGGGAAMVAAVTESSGRHAGALLKDAAKTIGGGGKPQPDVSVVGGREPEKLPEALDQVRAALGDS